MKLLHHRLEHSGALADSLLGQHVGPFLLQPQALQLLLSSLPAVASKQRQLYQNLCDLLQPGANFVCTTPTPCGHDAHTQKLQIKGTMYQSLPDWQSTMRANDMRQMVVSMTCRVGESSMER